MMRIVRIGLVAILVLPSFPAESYGLRRPASPHLFFEQALSLEAIGSLHLQTPANKREWIFIHELVSSPTSFDDQLNVAAVLRAELTKNQVVPEEGVFAQLSYGDITVNLFPQKMDDGTMDWALAESEMESAEALAFLATMENTLDFRKIDSLESKTLSDSDDENASGIDEILARHPKEKAWSEEEVTEVIENALHQIMQRDHILQISTRFGVQTANFLWALLGPRLNLTINEEAFAKLFNRSVMNMMADDVIQSSVNRMRLSTSKPGVADSGAPEWITPAQIGHADLVVTGVAMEKEIRALRAQGLVTAGREAVVRKQAQNYLRALEEEAFYESFFEEDPTAETPNRAFEAIDRLYQSEETPVLKEALRQLREDIKATKPLSILLRDAGLTAFFSIYQLLGTLYMLRLMQVLLGDAMGLGKTLQLLATWLVSGKKELLIVGPKASMTRWMEDLADFIHPESPIELDLLAAHQGPSRALLRNKKINVVRFKTLADSAAFLLSERKPLPKGMRRIMLMNLEAMRGVEKRRRAEKGTIRVPFLIIDEAHELRRSKSQQSQSIYGMEGDELSGVDAEWKIPASGTFLENGLDDLIAPIQYLARGGKSDEEKMFASLSVEEIKAHLLKGDPISASIIHAYLRTRMVRRRKTVLRNLPEKRFIEAQLDARAGTMRIVTAAKAGDQPVESRTIDLGRSYVEQFNYYEMARRYPEQFERDVKKINNLRRSANQLRSLSNIRCQQISVDPSIFGLNIGSIKLDAAMFFIDEGIASGKYILVFTEYPEAAQHLRRIIEKKYGEGFVSFVDGSVTDGKNNLRRSTEVERFQSGKSRVADMTYKAMGHAQELTQADMVISLDRPWTASGYDQMIDRAHRRDRVRNKPGRVLEIIDLSFQHPKSIDDWKGVVRHLKRMLSDMYIDGKLAPELLDAFESVEQRVKDWITDPREIHRVNPHELGLVEEVREKIAAIQSARSTAELEKLLEELGPLYAKLVAYKSSYFANRASLDYLSKRKEFKNRKLRLVDAGSGPSVMEQAYRSSRDLYDARDFHPEIVDYDLSLAALRSGLPRPGHQVLGSLDQLGSAFEKGSVDGFNFSYSWRYSAHPATMVQSMHSLLPVGGVVIVILPQHNKIPDLFLEGFHRAGFDAVVGKGGQLVSQVSDEDWNRLVSMYGSEIAKDIAQEAKSAHTYLVVKKSNRRPEKNISDEEFRLERVVSRMSKQKLDDILKSPGKLRFVAATTSIVGLVTGDVEAEGADTLAAPAESTMHNVLRRYTRLISRISDTIRMYQVHIRRKTLNDKALKDLKKQAEAQIASLKEMVLHPAIAFPARVQDELIINLSGLITQKFSRQWFKSDSTIRELIDHLKKPTAWTLEAPRKTRHETTLAA